MKKTMIAAAALAVSSVICGGATTAFAQDTTQAATERYSVETTLVGTLLDDPAAAAILERLIPSVYANEMFQNMGRPQTLRFVQQFEGAVLTDEMLARIQAEFDKLPAKE